MVWVAVKALLATALLRHAGAYGVPQVYHHVLASAADAELVASAVAREGAVVHASWLASVTLHEPIKVR